MPSRPDIYRDGMASNDCLPYENSYLAAADVSVCTAVVSVVVGVTGASVATGVTVVVSVVSVDSEPLLQAANTAAIANTERSFFMFRFLILFKQ